MLEDMNSKISVLERDRNKLTRDLETWTSEQSKNLELENDNRRLNQLCSVDKRALVKLREELVEEKLKCDNLSQQIEKVGKKISVLGIDIATLDSDDDSEIIISNERMKNLEGSMSQLLDSRERKIKTLETTLKELKQDNIQLQQEVEVLKLKAHGGDTKDQLTTMVVEKERLKTELSSVQMDLASCNDKINVYELKIRQLQEEVVSTQVENSTLQSQSTSLLSQINQLQTTQANIEASKRKLEEAERAWKTERDDLLRDQAGLQNLHDNLLQDYDKILKDKELHKEVEKQLRDDIRKLQSMSSSLNEDQEALLRAKEAIDAEKESLRIDSRTLSNLRAEHARLKDDFRSLFTSNDRLKSEYCNLTADFKGLKTTLNQTKLANTELKGQLMEAKEQLTLIDVECTKATNRCEVLTQMNMSLEEDRRSLMDQVSLLLTQYHELLTQTMDDKEHFHQEERCFADKVNNLSRQKEKLEEKIFEQYKRMENQTPKKIGFGGQIGKYIKKAGSNLILTSNKSRTPRQAGSASSRVSHTSGSAATSSSRVDGDGRNDNDSSSVDNDSIGSDHQSELPRSESASELGTRKSSFSSVQLQKTAFRKSMPTHLEDSDGNNADDDSLDSFMHRQNHFGYRENDDVPTRDVGPERLPNLFSQNISNKHSEVGLPIISSQDNRTRSISRIYVNGNKDISERSTTPQFSNWKGGHNSASPAPSNGSQGEITPPVVPARKHSRAGPQPDRPPQRPPKPSGRRLSDDNRSMSDASPTIDDDIKKENTEWYEYGCV